MGTSLVVRADSSHDKQRRAGSWTADSSVTLNPSGKYAEGGVAMWSAGSRLEGRDDMVDRSGKIKVDVPVSVLK